METARFITSKHNPAIKEALRIKDRKDKDHLLIEGEHAIEMAQASRFRIKRVFFSNRYRNPRLLKKLSRDAEIIETTDRIISALSDTEHPQGIIAIATYETSDLDYLSLTENPLIVVCDGIQDPGNLATIIRTADAGGANAVILMPGTCDPFMQKVIRASAGSIFNVAIVFSERDNLKKWLIEKGIRIIVTSQTGDKIIYDIDMKKPLALVLGNEARGVSIDWLDWADAVVRIPIFGKAESLNVAVAASIFLYEAIRQRIASQE